MNVVLRLADRTRYPLVCLLVLLLAASPAVNAAPAPDSFADLAARLLPAVVNISTTQTIKDDKTGKGDQPGPDDFPQFPPGSPFEEFFKDFLNKNRPHNGQQEALPRHATSLGSGFIIDPSGLVVTNNHVIADADEITVTLQDDTNFKAEVVGQATPRPIWRCCASSRPSRSPRSSSATAIRSGSATGCWRSAIPSGWAAR